jgi:hypothetical protein
MIEGSLAGLPRARPPPLMTGFRPTLAKMISMRIAPGLGRREC